MACTPEEMDCSQAFQAGQRSPREEFGGVDLIRANLEVALNG